MRKSARIEPDNLDALQIRANLDRFEAWTAKYGKPPRRLPVDLFEAQISPVLSRQQTHKIRRKRTHLRDFDLIMGFMPVFQRLIIARYGIKLRTTQISYLFFLKVVFSRFHNMLTPYHLQTIHLKRTYAYRNLKTLIRLGFVEKVGWQGIDNNLQHKQIKYYQLTIKAFKVYDLYTRMVTKFLNEGFL